MFTFRASKKRVDAAQIFRPFFPQLYFKNQCFLFPKKWTNLPESEGKGVIWVMPKKHSFFFGSTHGLGCFIELAIWKQFLRKYSDYAHFGCPQLPNIYPNNRMIGLKMYPNTSESSNAQRKQIRMADSSLYLFI